MPPAIALDATYSLGRNLTGVGVYCREIVHGLATENPEQPFRICYRSQRLLASFRERLPANCTRSLLTDSFSPARAALFHGLNQRMPNRRFRRACTTVHDLFVLTGEYSTPEFRSRFTQQVRHAVEQSDLVICVSNFTADSVCQLLNVEKARVRVIHHGVSLEPPAEDQPLAREPWILHTGALQHRKNLMRLIGAFEKGVAPGWRLVLAGGDGFGAAEIHARIATSSARHRIQALGYIDDADLRTLYRRASVFAFPSLDEGFGIPVLDAMANGIPVVASNRSSLPEVCGGAALLVDPMDEEDIADALRRLTESTELQSHYRELGRLRARDFTWPRAVAETWKVYLELLGSPALIASEGPPLQQSSAPEGTSGPEKST